MSKPAGKTRIRAVKLWSGDAAFSQEPPRDGLAPWLVNPSLLPKRPPPMPRGRS